jgi:hypothetical protein
LSFMLIVGVIVGVAAWNQRSATPLAWFALGLAIVLVPIVSLNVINHGPPLPTAAASWQLWEVNNERATGGYYAPGRTDDNPFRGLPAGEMTRRVQAKLGFQFIVANPVISLKNAWRRHLLQWRTDTAGYVWSYDRAEPDLQDNVPFGARTLREITDQLFITVVVLAIIGAIRGSHVGGVGLTLLLPIG